MGRGKGKRVSVKAYLFLLVIENTMFLVRGRKSFKNSEEIGKVHYAFINYIWNLVENINVKIKGFLENLLTSFIHLLDSDHYLTPRVLNTLCQSISKGFEEFEKEKKALCFQLLIFTTSALIKKHSDHTLF